METIVTHKAFNEKVKNSQAAIFYFSHEDCSVCKVLLPKIKELIKSSFTKMDLYYINVRNSPDVAAQNRIFAVPSILVFFEQKQYFQFSRNLGLFELEKAIERPYKQVFGNE